MLVLAQATGGIPWADLSPVVAVGLIFLAVLLALLKHNAAPQEIEIREGLAGNLCRCTGYMNIVKAVQQAAAAMRQPVGAAR